MLRPRVPVIPVPVLPLRRMHTDLLPTSIWSTQWFRHAQGIFFHSLSLRSTLILFSYLRLGLPSGLLPWSSSAKFLFDLFLPSMRDTCPLPPTLRDVFSLTTNYGVSRYPILSSHLLSLSRSHSFSFRLSRQRSYTFGLENYTETTVLLPIYQSARPYIPEQKFILTIIRFVIPVVFNKLVTVYVLV